MSEQSLGMLDSFLFWGDEEEDGELDKEKEKKLQKLQKLNLNHSLLSVFPGNKILRTIFVSGFLFHKIRFT